MVVATVCDFEIGVVIRSGQHPSAVKLITACATKDFVTFCDLLHGVEDVVVVGYAQKCVHFGEFLFKGFHISLRKATCDDYLLLF